MKFHIMFIIILKTWKVYSSFKNNFSSVHIPISDIVGTEISLLKQKLDLILGAVQIFI